MTRKIVHGIEIELPDDVDDETLFRFVLRRPDVGLTTPLAKTSRVAPSVQPSLVVSRRKSEGHAVIVALFDAANREALRTQPGFRVLRSGSGTSGGRAAVWQDISFVGPQQLVIFQRQIVIATEGDHHVVVTITAGQNDIEDVTARFGLNR